MRPQAGPAQGLVVEAQVLLRGRQAAVAKQKLQAPKVGLARQEVRRMGVPQEVRVDAPDDPGPARGNLREGPAVRV